MVSKKIRNVAEVVKKFVDQLNTLVSVDTVILFGSYARQQARDYSDLDLAVVSSQFHGGTEQDYQTLGQVTWHVNPLIEAIPFTPREIQRRTRGSFIDHILKTGKVVYQRPNKLPRKQTLQSRS